MEPTITVQEWVSVIREDYFQDFVRQGGAAVKFAFPETDETSQALVEAFRRAAQDNGYLFVALDAARVRLHMIDRVFHAVAQEVQWDELASRFLRTTLSEYHYLLPDEPEVCSLAVLAALNGQDLSEMRRDVNAVLRDRLYRDFAMTQEFRIGMLRLCQAQLEPNEATNGIARAVREWLQGELRLTSALKSAYIFQRIGRHNGRHMLNSLAHWLHLTGGSGLVLGLDISRFLLRRPSEPDGSIYYSGAAVLDGYEVLRQFVDGTDEMEHGFIFVAAPRSALLPKDENPRSVKVYDALWFRIADDVHDRNLVNPLASLVRIADYRCAPGRVPEGEALW